MELLKALSNADAIAAQEQEVRDILYDALNDKVDSVDTDGMGSIIFEKIGNKNGPKIMICGHMDEVGFCVRHITPMGQIILMTVGGVKPTAQFMQKVRITTQSGKKIEGIIQSTLSGTSATDTYLDIGATTAEEVFHLGIDVGDMVTYTTEFQTLDLENILIGKAFDDRLGCYVFAKVIERFQGKDHPNILYGVGTSSEEVGIRGAKTATYKVSPDIVFPVDVACYSNEFDRSYKNKRQIGEGMIVTNFDRTLAPNKALIEIIKKSAKKLNKNIQLDMFNSGGTDGGEAHKVNQGIPTAVTCLPVRYGHCAFSIVNAQDIEDIIDIYVDIIETFDWDTYHSVTKFIKETNDE
ncbi:peptidase M42 [Erysipelothrix larvae]|uniref:Peptidase M42 n=1 Tax=Erysipelothrix larvae TaxID=1514105 RepID=A0A0X8GYW5_9FIRM|nr:aminopeptidase [Erysipelothrix larvae]AMC92964.1 peptidase M42 [Erysipelothrix larvae]